MRKFHDPKMQVVFTRPFVSQDEVISTQRKVTLLPCGSNIQANNIICNVVLVNDPFQWRRLVEANQVSTEIEKRLA